jgi:hypothetical protein
VNEKNTKKNVVIAGGNLYLITGTEKNKSIVVESLAEKRVRLQVKNNGCANQKMKAIFVVLIM